MRYSSSEVRTALFNTYVGVLSRSLLSDKIPDDKKVDLMDRIEGLLDDEERRDREAGEAEYMSWRPVALGALASDASTTGQVARQGAEPNEQRGVQE